MFFPGTRTSWVVVTDRGGHLQNALLLFDQMGYRPSVLLVTYGPEITELHQSFSKVIRIPYLFSWLGKRRVLNPLKICFSFLWSLFLAIRLRPRVVISFGASNVIFFCVLSWLIGARLYHVECMNQVRTLSVTARILKYFCDAIFVQWPELESVEARCIYAGWVLS